MPRRLPLYLGLLLAAFIHLGAAAADARLILVGDSTIAPTSGYGNALCARFKPTLDCVNAAKGGRSTLSYRAEGLWDNVLQAVRDSKGTPVYVMIQFGHNDQPGKPGRSTDLVNDYPQNLARYVQEVRGLGATPILVTPLTRRSFKGPYVHNDLAPWAGATRRIAAELKVALVDLNAASLAAVQAMGPAQADLLAQEQPPHPKFDRTHLGEKGAGVFSAIMVRELSRAVPRLAAYVKT